MSENQNKTTIHPLVATAAGAVILASVVAVASMTGLFSQSGDKAPESIVAASASVDTLAQTASIPAASVVEETAPMPAASVVEEPAPIVSKPKPVVATKPKPKPVTPVVQQQQNQNQNQNQNQQAIPYERPLCLSCGTVESITSREVKADKGSGIGAVAGAVLGGVLGNQVGGGNGRKLATVAGAIGGGMAGNEIEKRKNSQMVYEVKVMMDNGEIRTFTPNNAPQWRSGDKVKVVDGQLTFQ